MIVRIELPRTAILTCLVGAVLQRGERSTRPLPGVVGVGGTMDFFMRRNGDQSVTVEGRPSTRRRRGNG